MKFILTADEKEKPLSFFPLWEVIVFIVIVVIILLALFPRNLLQKVLSYDQPSPVILSYLQAFHEQYPQDSQVLLALIEQEIGMDQFESAQKNIAALKNLQVNPTTEALDQYHWLDYLLLRAQTYQAKSHTPEHDSYLKQLRQTAKNLANQPLSIHQLKILAADNLGLGQVAITLQIYNQLLARNALVTPEELAEGGSIAMQNNAHQDSAKFYKEAYNKAEFIQEKRKYAMEVIKVLWAGNLTKQALAFAQTLPNAIINDKKILVYLAKLALAANRPDVAQQYILKALSTKSNKT